MKALNTRSVLVLGLGESGLAMAKWCSHCGARVRVADSRAQPPGLDALGKLSPAPELRLGQFSLDLLDGVDLIALSPGLDVDGPLPSQARACGIPVVGEMTLFAWALEDLGVRADTRILAITGTNGKTTTTAMTAALVSACGIDAVAAGNISPAVLDVLLERIGSGQTLPACWVLELSSFQIESMEGLAPDAAVVLNLSDDHLDRHGSMARYAGIKAQIYRQCAVQLINRDDLWVRQMPVEGRLLRSFGLGVPQHEQDYGLTVSEGQQWLQRGRQRLLSTRALRLQGQHNALNALAALALGEAIECPLETMLEALKRFDGLPHRMSLVASRSDGVRYYNDSKGTNVGATVAAMTGMHEPVVLIAGGDGKGQDFSPLREQLADKARAVLLIGKDARHIADALSGIKLPVIHCQSLQQAVIEANGLARAGDVVLLSPACASLDMFRNYADRGRQFVDAVLALPGVSDQ